MNSVRMPRTQCGSISILLLLLCTKAMEYPFVCVCVACAIEPAVALFFPYHPTAGRFLPSFLPFYACCHCVLRTSYSAWNECDVYICKEKGFLRDWLMYSEHISFIHHDPRREWCYPMAFTHNFELSEKKHGTQQKFYWFSVQTVFAFFFAVFLL